FGYQDLLPNVNAQVAVTAADVAPQDVEYTYSIKGGPWSVWKSGPTLQIDDPVRATQKKLQVRTAAPRARDASSGSKEDATFDFVNDYAAPTVQLDADGALVSVRTQDNVYDQNELTMQVRVNGGDWSDAQPIHDIDIMPELLQGKRAVL